MLLIGTTLEVLASQGREMFRVARWRKHMEDHVVVVGYGTKGRSAVDTLVNNGQDREPIVIVDPPRWRSRRPTPTAWPSSPATPPGASVLRRAGVGRRRARSSSPPTATTPTCSPRSTVRQLNPDAWIVAAVREQENAPLMRQSGANSVITSSDAVGRLLGLSSLSPTLGSVMEDLLTYGEGLEVAERDLLVPEVGKQPQSLPDQVIAVVRDEKVYRYFDPVVTQLARGDRLVVVRPAKELPWAPRPGTHDEDVAGDRGLTASAQDAAGCVLGDRPQPRPRREIDLQPGPGEREPDRVGVVVVPRLDGVDRASAISCPTTGAFLNWLPLVPIAT